MCFIYFFILGVLGICDVMNDVMVECNVENISCEKFMMLYNFLCGDMDYIVWILWYVVCLLMDIIYCFDGRL